MRAAAARACAALALLTVSHAGVAPFAAARNAALKQELELWERMLAYEHGVESDVLESLLQVRATYNTPSDALAAIPSAAAERLRDRGLHVREPQNVTDEQLEMSRGQGPPPADAVAEKKKALRSFIKKLSASGPSFLQIIKNKKRPAALRVVRYKHASWTEDGEWREASSRGELRVDGPSPRSSPADGADVVADEDVFGADGSPDDEPLPSDDEGGQGDDRSDRPAGQDAREDRAREHRLEREFQQLLAMREDAGVITYRAVMDRARSVGPSSCPALALRCIAACHKNATSCSHRAANGDGSIARPSPFKKPQGYDDVPGAIPELDNNQGPNRNKDAGRLPTERGEEIEGTFLPDSETSTEALPPAWKGDPMFDPVVEEASCCGPTINKTIIYNNAKPPRGSGKEGGTEEAEEEPAPAKLPTPPEGDNAAARSLEAEGEKRAKAMMEELATAKPPPQPTPDGSGSGTLPAAAGQALIEEGASTAEGARSEDFREAGSAPQAQE